LGVPAALGRTFRLEESREPVAVLDYQCWRQRFAQDPAIVGKAIVLNGQALTVIGIAPARFEGTQIYMRPEAYVPLQAMTQAGPDLLEHRENHQLRVMARLQPEVTLEQARAAVNLLAAELARQYPDTNQGVTVLTIPERFARP